MKKLNWTLIAADITAGLTAMSMIPYDKDTMNIINQLVPPQWIPWIIKAGIVSTMMLRLYSRYFVKSQPSTATP